MLKLLTETAGVSGFCSPIRKVILENIKSGEVTVDALGNIIVYKKGKKSDKKVMFCAHMDEVGFMVTGINDKGYLKFTSCGGIDTRVIVSKRVRVGDKKIPGVIAYKAVHLQSGDEKGKAVDEEKLSIDIGAKDKEEAEKLASVGDYITFDTEFSYFGDDFMKGKALDDRVGCACLIELCKKEWDYDFYGVFSVCEEVGGIGARAAAARIKPDIALVLEGTTASDVYGCEEKDYVTHLGGGVCIPVRDRSMIANRKIVDFLKKCASDAKIKWQYKNAATGGTDGGSIHITGEGIPTAILALPCRYIHSPVGVACVSDYEAMIRLADVFATRALEILM